MSFVTAYPQLMEAAVSDLQTIGAALAVGNGVAAGPTTAVVPAAADEVSELTAAQFAVHAQRYQVLAARSVRIQEFLVATLAANADLYSATEAANAAAAR